MRIKTLLPILFLFATACKDSAFETDTASGSNTNASIDQNIDNNDNLGCTDCGDNDPNDDNNSNEADDSSDDSASEQAGKKELDTSAIPQHFLDYVRKNLPKQRYMERNCRPFEYPGYEGLPTIYCEYSIKGAPMAPVVMLNASPDQLAAWIIDSCTYLGKNIHDCAYKLYNSVRIASGAQFAVAGIVYENLNGNSKAEAYVFRHGVTVKVTTFSSGTEMPLNWKHFNDALWGYVPSTMRYARIVSTSREQYYQYMKREGLKYIDVGTSKAGQRKVSWMDEIRRLYIAGWGEQTNHLMRAWAYDNRWSL